MILYFSGTGNSRYVAQVISSVTGDNIVSINELLKNGSKDTIKSDKPFVFVCPTYAWRIPKVVDDYIREVRFEGNKKAYFILTCGSETYNAAEYTKKICKEKGFDFMGLSSVLMPENYIAMFDAPDKEKAAVIIKKASPQIQTVAEQMKNGQILPEEKVTLKGKLVSSMINPIFYKMYVSTKGFYTEDTCNSCGKCVKSCPLNNIKLTEGKPQWGANCTHCMACICGCPTEAIEYKNNSKGKPRYYNQGYQER
ncbi:MAG TPA: EFR1 family ferrodoxin [Mobilitalea sp.]|nr:EFR1 family ferrodoxin [Mobilitalea sp.]